MSKEADRATAAILRVDDLVKQFGGVTAVDNARFDVPDGTITGIIGPNGAGKTTTFNLISGILKPDHGTIRLQGEEIQGRSPPQLSSIGVGRTFQTPRIFSGMSVRDNLKFAHKDQTGETILGALLRRKAVVAETNRVSGRADEMLDLLELSHLAEDYARGLSGGQRKLLELGRVLMTDPAVLLLDEPTAGVNPVLTNQLLERIHDINNEGTTIVIIEHDMDIIMNHCDHVIVMHQGATLLTGPPSVIKEDDTVLDAYLGRDI